LRGKDLRLAGVSAFDFSVVRNKCLYNACAVNASITKQTNKIIFCRYLNGVDIERLSNEHGFIE